MICCEAITGYIDYVKAHPDDFCREQHLLVSFIDRVFSIERLKIDEDQLAKYLSLQTYFPYRLFEWEQFCFALHNCVYRPDGELRFPELVIFVGRGTGKNGYLAFEDFCLLTPVNGIISYNIDIFATSEDQAKMTFEDIYNVLEANRPVMKEKFRWNLEEIQNRKTLSKLKFRTSAAETKDGGRPGKIDFDEYHAYKNKKLIKVAVTGLGKKKHPRRTIISTFGDIRGGPCDEKLQQCLDILTGALPDNGVLPFICRCDNDEEIMDRSKWCKANPSLRYMPDLQHELDLEFIDYQRDPAGNADFATKRMNRPQMASEEQICSWDDVLSANEAPPELTGESCICGIDYTLLSDFAAIGLLFKKGKKRYWITHSWVCSKSRDLDRIKFPIDEAERRGLLTIVDDVEIKPELLTDWLVEKSKLYTVKIVCCDTFRFALLRAALEKIGFVAGKNGTIWLTRTSEIIKVAPVVVSMFLQHLIAWGDNMLMRWYTWNVKRITEKGNTRFEKIEPKSRKTDGFFALCHAMTKEDLLDSATTSVFLPPIISGR